jgi:class 3 adenylate cyclase
MNRSTGLNELPAERRLAAILAADVVGYSRLMGADEIGTLRALKAMRSGILDPLIASCRGRIVKTTGDGVLVEFASVVDAVVCAVAVQRDMLSLKAAAPSRTALTLRIGVNIGDIIIDGGDIFGDGVNLASRLESICEPGGVTISRAVHEQVHDKLAYPFVDQGDKSVKNIMRPVRVFGLRAQAIAAMSQAALPGRPERQAPAFAEEEDEGPTETRKPRPAWKKWRTRLILLIIAAFVLWHQDGVRRAVENFLALVRTTPASTPTPKPAPSPTKPAELTPLPPPVFVPLPPGSAEKPATANPTGGATPTAAPSPPAATSPSSEPSPPPGAKPAGGGELPPPLELHPQD